MEGSGGGRAQRGRKEILNLLLLVLFSNGQEVNMKALILCIIRLVLLKGEGQIERSEGRIKK